MGVSALSAWTLAGAPLGVQELWPRFVRATGQGTLLDAGIPKSASEWLLVGHAHATEPETHLAVTVEVGEQRKVLNVVGDRLWREGVPTSPEAFVKMPIDWAHAFGGQGYPDNPLGKGYVVGFADAVELPNVEVPGRMMSSPRERPPPAGFGAFALDWPQRMRGLGTYDQAWFENDFPGFAKDIDWRVHNTAPEDQRVDAPFAPGQRIVLHNLVEARPRVDLSVPRVTARCFTYRDEATCSLTEVPLALRTIWLLPDEDMLVLVSQGSQPIAGMLGSEIKGVVLALDADERRRDVEHFGRLLARRLDRELGAAEMLDDRPLMPDGMHFPDFEERAEDMTMPTRAGALEANLQAGAELRRQEALKLLAAAGFEGAEALFPPLAPPAHSSAPLAEQVKDALVQAEHEQKEAAAKVAALREEAVAEMTRLGFDPGVFDKAPSGPPPILAEQRLAMLTSVVREARISGHPLAAFERQLDDPSFHREIIESESKGREAYRLAAHRTDAIPDVPVERAMVLREQVEAAIRDRSSLAQADLTGAELAELDLSGLDLRGAWLEGANLQKANLESARLDSAVLAKADLAEAVLRGTSFHKANLGSARLLWTGVEACDLSGAILGSADLRGARIVRSNLAGADLSSVRVEQTAFEQCDLSSVMFISMSLAGVGFAGSKLDDCTFIEVQLDGTSFQACRLAKAVFITCTGNGASFRDANLENARFVARCVFDGADFQHAVLPRSTLRDCSFVRSNFDEANLAGSDLSQAKLSEARFYRADLRRVLATECDLRSAIMNGSNLMFAVLQGSDLRGAELRGANLFSVDLALVHADAATSFEGALVTRVRHRPLRREASSS